ncbi:MAG: DNA-directed RNA polymerase subunit omega [Planctomycetota bacterium]
MDQQLLKEARRRVGGIFKLTALLQKRCRELVKGASPLVNPKGLTPIEVALKEAAAGLIELVPDDGDGEAESDDEGAKDEKRLGAGLVS